MVTVLGTSHLSRNKNTVVATHVTMSLAVPGIQQQTPSSNEPAVLATERCCVRVRNQNRYGAYVTRPLLTQSSSRRRRPSNFPIIRLISSLAYKHTYLFSSAARRSGGEYVTGTFLRLNPYRLLQFICFNMKELYIFPRTLYTRLFEIIWCLNFALV
jgi:hypothetical protein